MDDVKVFNNRIDETAFYKMKYFKNKEKLKILLEMQNKLRKEHTELQGNYNKLKEDLDIEKSLRKKIEEKVLKTFKSENTIESKLRSNSEYNVIDRKTSNERLGIGSILDENELSHHKNSGIDSISSFDRDNDSNLNSTCLKEKTLKEITNKFDIDILKKSLIVDFLEYDRDTLAIRRKIIVREDKINKLEKLLKVWFDNSEQLKKQIDYLILSLTTFNDQFAKDLDIFEECPDLISLIYTLQSVVSDLINQFKIFAASIENSFTHQIKNFINIIMPEFRETKQSLAKHTDEFNFCSNKYLNTKKFNIKEHTKDAYNSQFRVYEFTRYDYINKINMILIFTKVDLPEKVSLFIYSLMVHTHNLESFQTRK
jgi:hypothetical protein